MAYNFHPFAEEYPLLEGDEFRALVESIHQDGQEMPIYVWRAQIIDGRNRYLACQELGIACKTVDVSHLDENELPDLIARLNLHRRHLSPEWRQQRAAKLRAEGKSYRAIAEELGVSHETIRSDLQSGVKNLTPDEVSERTAADDPGINESGVKNLTSEEGGARTADDQPCVDENLPPPTPAALRTVIGRDGKQYPAETAKPKVPKQKTIADRLKEAHYALGVAIRRLDEVGQIKGRSRELIKVFGPIQSALNAFPALKESLGVKA